MSKLLKGYSVDKFKSKKPPSNSSFDTAQQIKHLAKIPINKKFIKDNDNIEAAFKKVAKEKGIKDYDETIASSIIEKSAPIILKLKKHFNRPRPKVIAKKNNIKMEDVEMASMKTPSYPSGHSVQGILIARVLSDKYPKAKKAFNKT